LPLFYKLRAEWVKKECGYYFNMSSLQEFILSLLIDGGKLLIESQPQAGAGAQSKSAHDLVTFADLACENLIVNKILKAFPSHKIYSEERKRIADDLFSPNCWIIDPLDGTNNYAYGFPIWGISIAYAQNGILKAGGIAYPLQGIYLFAQKGAGAWEYKKSAENAKLSSPKPLRVSSRKSLQKSMVLVCAHLTSKEYGMQHLEGLGRIASNVFNVRALGSAAFNLGFVACGLADACVEFKLQPYDGAAGALLIEEAGGKITDLYGNKWRLDAENMVCSNGLVHDQLIEAIAWGEKGKI
jgi:myo-inositol-1(or 4)-monophosphatase